MSEHDPINELSRFGADLGTRAGGDMPLSAEQVRHRGNQIRRRRTAWVAAGAALAVAAVAVPIFAVAGGDADRDSGLVAEDPTSSATVPARPSLGLEDLLPASDTEYTVGEPTPWVEIDTYEGDGQATFHVCQREKVSALGAIDSFTRFYDWGGTEPVAGTGLSETVAQFPDEATASAAYEEISNWLEDCSAQVPDAERSSVFGPRNLDAAGGDRSQVYDISWGPAPADIDPNPDSGYLNETGVVQVGDRIAVLSLTIVGMDYNWLDEDGGTPVFRMLATAAARLD